MTADPMEGGRTRGVLFLCVANSARSQMAHALARELLSEGVRVFSAGSRPASVNPLALRALEEESVDTSGLRSRGIPEIPVEEVDLVVTLCAEEVCPVFPRPVERLHWPLPDPAAAQGTDGERLEAFRRVRDELRRRIGELAKELG